MNRQIDPQLTIILESFEQAWGAGAAPEIRDFLPDESTDSTVSRRAALIELVMIDLERRWRADPLDAATLTLDVEQFPSKPTLEDYVSRYSELGPIESIPVELIVEEYRVRRLWGDGPSHDEYLRRFPAYAEELHSTLADSDAASIDVTINQMAPSQPREASSTIAGPSTGERVRYFGEYELLEEIARGAMGVVFKARQVKLNRIVALKMILSGALAGEEEVRRFKAEAEAAANLDHPGIVPIYEIGEHEGQYYFSMGFVDGQSLADRVKDRPLPPREAAETVKKVAEAVAYAHEKGVIHRDLKPANILLDTQCEPRVTDFGLAKQIESDSDLTRTGTVMGTPSYMSPEQARGATTEIGVQSDVYSLGAVLYCLLAGCPPFQSATAMGVLRQVLEQDPVDLRQLNAAVPKDLETICLKCLQKSPSRRYASASDLRSELTRFLSHEPIRARRISEFEDVRRWFWKNAKEIAGGYVLVQAANCCIAILSAFLSSVLVAWSDWFVWLGYLIAGFVTVLLISATAIALAQRIFSGSLKALIVTQLLYCLPAVQVLVVLSKREFDEGALFMLGLVGIGLLLNQVAIRRIRLENQTT